MTFIIRNFFGCVVLRFHQINLKDIFYLSKLLAGLYVAFALLETGSTVKLLRLYRLFSFGSLRPLTPASIICPSSSLQIGCLCSTWSSLSHADGAPPLGLRGGRNKLLRISTIDIVTQLKKTDKTHFKRFSTENFEE